MTLNLNLRLKHILYTWWVIINAFIYYPKGIIDTFIANKYEPQIQNIFFTHIIKHVAWLYVRTTTFQYTPSSCILPSPYLDVTVSNKQIVLNSKPRGMYLIFTLKSSIGGEEKIKGAKWKLSMLDGNINSFTGIRQAKNSKREEKLDLSAIISKLNAESSREKEIIQRNNQVWEQRKTENKKKLWKGKQTN